MFFSGSFSRCFMLLAALLFMSMSDGSFAAQRSHGMVTKEEKSLRGTWYSAKGTLTFKDNGTINYKGKRYLCDFQWRPDTTQRKAQFECDSLSAFRGQAHLDG